MGRSGPALARPTASVHVGRQPILDVHGHVYGYELLFRGTAQAPMAGVQAADADAATTATILSAFSEFGSQLLGGRLGFVNLTRAFIVGELPVPFPPASAVLEVLESIEIDDEVVEGARRRIAEGHRLALDDFVWTPEAAQLLELADIVKLDVLEPTWDEVIETIARCAPHNVRFLAERVEDAAMYEKAKAAGFELFQGFHLGRPQTMSVESLGPGQVMALQMLAKLADADTTARDVEALLRTDPALSVRLLRIANSAHMGLSRSVSSIRDAVVFVGLARLRAWMVLIVMASSSVAEERIGSALVRARTCELAAGKICGGVRPDIAFTLGLLHGVAEALHLAPDELVTGMPALADDLKGALVGDPGPLRTVLDAVLAYEKGDLDRPSGDPDGIVGIADAYLQALAWTTRTVAGADQA